MARIVDAGKIEILRNIVVKDAYPDVTIEFVVDADGDPRIVISVADPRVAARDEVRVWAKANKAKRDTVGVDVEVGLAMQLERVRSSDVTTRLVDPRVTDDEDTALLDSLLDFLGEKDIKTQQSWGAEQGKQLPYSFVVYLPRKDGVAIANLLAGKELTNETRETIRTALTESATTNTKGF